MQMWKDDAREIRRTWFLADADVKLYDFRANSKIQAEDFNLFWNRKTI